MFPLQFTCEDPREAQASNQVGFGDQFWYLLTPPCLGDEEHLGILICSAPVKQQQSPLGNAPTELVGMGMAHGILLRGSSGSGGQWKEQKRKNHGKKSPEEKGRRNVREKKNTPASISCEARQAGGS